MRVLGAEVADVLCDDATLCDCLPGNTNALNKKVNIFSSCFLYAGIIKSQCLDHGLQRVRNILSSFLESPAPPPSAASASVSQCDDVDVRENQSEISEPIAQSGNNDKAPPESVSNAEASTESVLQAQPATPVEKAQPSQQPADTESPSQPVQYLVMPSVDLQQGRACIAQCRPDVALEYFRRAEALARLWSRECGLDGVDVSEVIAAADACGELSFCLQLGIGLNFIMPGFDVDTAVGKLKAALATSSSVDELPKRAFELASLGHSLSADSHTATAALARCHRDGIGCSSDIDVALQLARSACLNESNHLQNVDVDAIDESIFRNSTCQWSLPVWAGCLQRIDRHKLAVSLLERAALAESPAGAVNLALNIEDLQPQRAFELYQFAAMRGNVTAMVNLALCLQAGQPETAAWSWWERAACLGDRTAAKRMLGRAQSVNKAADVTKWMLWCAVLEPNDAGILSALAARLREGVGCERSVVVSKFAVQLLKTAAQFGDTQAMFEFGVSLESGDVASGGVRDASEALQWIQRAAQAGHAEAACQLAMSYASGSAALVRNDALAFEWYSKAASAGSLRALLGRGHHLERGLGVEKNVADALECYQRAAEKGDPIAMNILGCRFETGACGVPNTDLKTALLWYTRAAAGGNSDATVNQRRLDFTIKLLAGQQPQ
jgi:TPR repeat protein